jgi:hypothetical protein
MHKGACQLCVSQPVYELDTHYYNIPHIYTLTIGNVSCWKQQVGETSDFDI